MPDTEQKRKKVRRRKDLSIETRLQDWQANDGDWAGLSPDLVEEIRESGPSSRLADIAFAENTWEAFCAGMTIGAAEGDQDATERQYRGPEALYRKSKDHRRVLFLELMAWAISEIERYDMTAELEEHKLRIWGERPWSGATNADEFKKHVLDLAKTFTEADGAGGAWYANRKHGPLAGMDT
jgi:hypothetical protein